MKPAEYLDKTKERLSLSSDYALAKKFEVSKQEISNVRYENRGMSPYLAAKIAITLELDPAEVIADIESQHEKNPVRADFWRSFLGRAAMGLMLAVTLGCLSIGNGGSVPSAGLGGFKAWGTLGFAQRVSATAWLFLVGVVGLIMYIM